MSDTSDSAAGDPRDRKTRFSPPDANAPSTNAVKKGQIQKKAHDYEKRLAKMQAKVQKAIETNDVQTVIDSLTMKQKLFCEEYVRDFNGTRSIYDAGYKAANDTYAANMAVQLLKRPDIKFVIDALTLEKRREIVENPELSIDYVIAKIKRTLETAETDNNYSAVLRAAELLGKHLGAFVDRTEVSGPAGAAIQYEQTQKDVQEFTNNIRALAAKSKAKLSVVKNDDDDDEKVA